MLLWYCYNQLALLTYINYVPFSAVTTPFNKSVLRELFRTALACVTHLIYVKYFLFLDVIVFIIEKCYWKKCKNWTYILRIFFEKHLEIKLHPSVTCTCANDSFWNLVRLYRPFWYFKPTSYFLRLDSWFKTLKFSKVYLLDKRSFSTSFLIFDSVKKNWFLVCKLHTSHMVQQVIL